MKHRFKFSQNIHKNSKFIKATKHFHGTNAYAFQPMYQEMMEVGGGIAVMVCWVQLQTFTYPNLTQTFHHY